MNMKKNIWIMVLMLTVIAVFLIGCSKNKSKTDNVNDTTNPSAQNNQTEATSVDATKEGSDQPDPTDEKKEVKTITFLVPDFCHINTEYLKLLNKELVKDGHDYQLALKFFEFDFETDQYFNIVESELKNGTADVAFIGLGDSKDNVYKVIDSGAAMELDDVLASDSGKALYEAFPKPLWESVTCKGHIYSIPNANWEDNGLFVAFNKDYIPDEAIEKWDGSIEGIYSMIKDVKWDDSAAPRFQYLVPDFDFAEMIDCEIKNGLLYDYDSMQIVNPLESEKFIGYIRVLEQMKSDGFMAKSAKYRQNASYAQEEANLESGNYLVVLSAGAPEEYYMKDNICVKKIAPYLQSRINGTIAISSKTEDIDAIMDFLGLLYGEGKYGNLLIYGKMDENYKLENGYAVNMDGTDIPEQYMTKICMDLFINLYPVKGERLPENRKETYFSFYDEIKVSPFFGFNPDIEDKSAINKDLDDFLESLNRESLDESLSEYTEKFKSDGIDEYVTSVKAQWETYKNAT